MIGGSARSRVGLSDRVSTVAAMTTGSRYRQVTAAITGFWSRSEIN
jgi:hypothetical protein